MANVNFIDEMPLILEEIDAMVVDDTGIIVEICLNIWEDDEVPEGTEKYKYRRCCRVSLNDIPKIVEKLRELHA